MKGKIGQLYDIFVKGCKKHSPEIAIGVGIASMAVSVVSAVRETPKALDKIEEMKSDLGKDELTAKETIQTAWKCYIPSAVSFMIGVFCICLASKTYLGRIAAVGAVVSMKEDELDILKKKTAEMFGEKKKEELADAVEQERVDRNPVGKNEITTVGGGNILCYDVSSGRYFRSTKDKVDTAFHELNYQMNDELTVNLNDFYYHLGLSDNETGRILGWDVANGPIRPRYTSTLAENDEPCLVISFEKPAGYLWQ